MTAKQILDDIECSIVVAMNKRIVPKAIALNGKTKEKIMLTVEYKNITAKLEVFIDDKLADDEFRILRK